MRLISAIVLAATGRQQGLWALASALRHMFSLPVLFSYLCLFSRTFGGVLRLFLLGLSLGLAKKPY